MAEGGADFRRHFSGFGGKAYLDSAAMGPFPLETSEAVRQALRFKEHPEEIEPELFEALPDRARAAAARLIACSPSSITLGTGASHGLNAAALGLPLRRGDEVLIPAGEFPAVVLPFVNLAPAGITVRRVPGRSGRIVEAEDVIQAIGPKTRLVAVSLVTYNTGYRIDAAAIGEACQKQGLFFVVDGAQAIGAIDFRVADHAVDVLAVSGYKWLLAPYGTGFTYVSPRVLDRMRVAQVNWQTVEGATRLNRPADDSLKFHEGAARFDAPEGASFLNVAGFAASVEFVNRVRVPTIEAHVLRLLDRLILGLSGTVLRIASSLDARSRSAILACDAGSIDATRRAWKRLGEAGVVVSLRDNLIRISPHIYNTAQDVDRFLEVAAGLL